MLLYYDVRQLTNAKEHQSHSVVVNSVIMEKKEFMNGVA